MICSGYSFVPVEVNVLKSNKTLNVRSLGKPVSFVFPQVLMFPESPSAYGSGGLGEAAAPPVGKKNSIIRAKLMYRSGKDTVKNNLLFNILIYLFSSRISPYLLTDLCTTSRDGCYYSELEH